MTFYKLKILFLIFNMLHIIQKSPFQSQNLDNCLQNLTAGDAILFIEDGVLGLLNNTKLARQLKKHQEFIFMYALGADLETRGIQNQIISDIQLINYDGFVELTVAHSPITTWS